MWSVVLSLPCSICVAQVKQTRAFKFERVESIVKNITTFVTVSQPACRVQLMVSKKASSSTGFLNQNVCMWDSLKLYQITDVKENIWLCFF